MPNSLTKLRTLLLAGTGALVGPLAAVAGIPDYLSGPAPIFKRYCNACHNADDQEGKLVLESYASLLAGGQHGAAIVPGDSGASRLIQVLTGKVKPRMPPEDEDQPTAEEIASLSAWIDAGAKGPEGAEPDPTILAAPKITPTRETPAARTALACSPVNDLLASAHSGVVELARRGQPTPLRRLAGHRGRVTSLSFSADGSQLLAAAGEPGLFGEVRQWNVADGALVHTFQGHRDSLYTALLSPDGTLLATSSYDQTVKLWDVASGAERRTLTGHNDAVYDLAFRPDGRVLASASGDRTLKLWDVGSGARLDTLSQSLKELYAVAFHPDGKQVAAGGVDNRIRVWNVSADAKENTNPLVMSRFAHEGAIIRLAYSRDGHTLVSAGEDKLIKIWDSGSMSLRQTLETQSDWPAALAIASDGTSLFVGRLDGSQAEYPLGPATAIAAEAKPLDAFPSPVWYGEQPALDQLPRVGEVEPNDTPAQATPLAAPAVGTGRIKSEQGQAADADLFRFEAQAGQQWMIETNAARSDAPLDTRIEVLHADGRPVERLLLRAVRDSELEFRSENSADRGLRVANWEEMQLNDFLYIEGEVLKHYRQRRGPDSDAEFYPEAGDRHTYFDTSPRTHALGCKCYIVEPYALGSQLPYNGLPVFKLNFENDDDGGRTLGRDSRLAFTAPADGAYLVRVTDVRGFSGDNFQYQLIVRRPQPGFNVSLSDRNPTVAAGSGKRIKVVVDRIDGFWGAVRIDIGGLPPGFYVTTPIVVEAGHRAAQGVLYAHPDAPPPKEENWRSSKITATAMIADHELTKNLDNLGKIQLEAKPQVIVRLAPEGQEPRLPIAAGLAFPQPADVSIVAGKSVALQLSVERNGFDGIINFEPDNLPHGVIVENVGLNGIQLLEGQTQRTLSLAAEGWLPKEDRLVQLYAKEAGVQVSLPLLLHVRSAPALPAGQQP